MVKGSRRERTTALASVVGILEIYVSGPGLQTALREAGPEVSGELCRLLFHNLFLRPHEAFSAVSGICGRLAFGSSFLAGSLVAGKGSSTTNQQCNCKGPEDRRRCFMAPYRVRLRQPPNCRFRISTHNPWHAEPPATFRPSSPVAGLLRSRRGRRSGAQGIPAPGS